MNRSRARSDSIDWDSLYLPSIAPGAPRRIGDMYTRTAPSPLDVRMHYTYASARLKRDEDSITRPALRAATALAGRPTGPERASLYYIQTRPIALRPVIRQLQLAAAQRGGI